ncbi:MAG: hypothetical protein QGH29_03220 [Kiritimatiellia bacterium]|jgi:hypothetical protein|nr:hypothetical protein [Kiritimatiellia bacterium]
MGAEEYVTHETCSETSRQVLGKLESIEKRLFRDNGTVSIQTRLDRHEQVIRGMLWGISVVGGALLTSIVVGMVFLFRTVLLRA